MASSQSGPSPRRSRGISFRSDKTRSRHSKEDASENNTTALLESNGEGAHQQNLSAKADPLLAMSEAQPMAVAHEKSNLGSLRDIRHKDQYGNLITEPDRSNPTRPRFERPLETIRSFESAIYGTYGAQNSRPVSFARTDEADYSRRDSYFGGFNGSGTYPTRGYDQAGYMARGNQSRPTSYADAYSNPPADNFYPYNQGGRPRPPRYNPRANPEQAMYRGNQNGYQQYGYGYQGSYENVAASGSGSNPEPWNNAPDPTYVNGSSDRLAQQHRMMEDRAAADYGFQGFGPSPNLDHNMSPTTANGGGPYSPAPARHPHEKPLPDPTAGDPPAPAPARRIQRKAANGSDTGEKRKSWFKRRFSRD